MAKLQIVARFAQPLEAVVRAVLPSAFFEQLPARLDPVVIGVACQGKRQPALGQEISS